MKMTVLVAWIFMKGYSQQFKDYEIVINNTSGSLRKPLRQRQRR